MSKMLLFMILVVAACNSQHDKRTYSNEAVLCWSIDTVVESCSTIVYCRDYYASNPDSGWEIIGVTTDTAMTVARKGLMRVVYGVRSFIGDDTSEMHSSMDSTACMTSDGCDAICKEYGWWSLQWTIPLPKMIKLGKK